MQRSKRFLSGKKLNDYVKFSDFIFSIQDISELYIRVEKTENKVNATPAQNVFNENTILVDNNYEILVDNNYNVLVK